VNNFKLAELVTSDIQYISIKGFNKPRADVIILFSIPLPQSCCLVRRNVYLLKVEYRGTIKEDKTIFSYGINSEYDNPPILNGLKGYLEVNTVQLNILKSISKESLNIGIKWKYNRVHLKENNKEGGYIYLNLRGKDIEFTGFDIDINSNPCKVDKRRKGIRLQLRSLKEISDA